MLTARGLRPDLKIIARASEEEATSKLLRAGASQVLSPYHFIGHRMPQSYSTPTNRFPCAAFGRERLDFEISDVRRASLVRAPECSRLSAMVAHGRTQQNWQF